MAARFRRLNDRPRIGNDDHHLDKHRGLLLSGYSSKPRTAHAENRDNGAGNRSYVVLRWAHVYTEVARLHPKNRKSSNNGSCWNLRHHDHLNSEHRPGNAPIRTGSRRIRGYHVGDHARHRRRQVDGQDVRLAPITRRVSGKKLKTPWPINALQTSTQRRQAATNGTDDQVTVTRTEHP